MKKIIFTLCALAMVIMPIMAQDIITDPDSLYKEASASDFDISMLAHIWNYGDQDVTIKWERNIEEIPDGWSTSFCDKNACYAGAVATHQFNLLENGDSSILKPIFRPFNVPGTCIYRVNLTSETPGIDYQESVVYIAVATVVNSTAKVLSAKDVVVYPNPATDELTVAIANSNFKGSWIVTNATGQVVLNHPDAPATGQVDTSTLGAGIYFLNIRTQDGQLVAAKKFFVQ